VPAAATAAEVTLPEQSAIVPERVTLEEAVRSYYETLQPEDLEDIKTVRQANNSIPQPYDGRMLARTGTLLGHPLEISEKREMRRIFGRLLEGSS
jgi:hypothetical protein